jgi:hypothetical protein
MSVIASLFNIMTFDIGFKRVALLDYEAVVFGS